MKWPLFCMLFLLLFNFTDIDAIQKEPQELEIKKYQLYTYYFIIKEFYNLFTTPYFLMHHTKMSNAKITCCKCNHHMTASNLWAYSAVHVQEPLLKELLSVFHNESIDELVLFTLARHQEYQIRCNKCLEYSGYYIPKEASSSQN